jgi:hypothetical protein
MNTYGLLLRTNNRHGSEYLIAELVRREGEHDAPRNCSDGLFTEEGRPKHLESLRLQDLRMQGFLQTCSPHELIGFEPAFYDVYSVDERDAKRMARTLKLINDRIRKDCAHNAVDCFVALCSALRLSFVVECRDENQRSSYDDNKWYWMSIAEGRNRYRHMIEQLVKQRAA